MHWRYNARKDLEYIYLQGVLEELVHLGDLGGNAEVNGAVTDLDDEASLDLGVDLARIVSSAQRSAAKVCWPLLGHLGMTHLGDDLELLALANVLRLGNGGLELAEDLVVEGLFENSKSVYFCLLFPPGSAPEASDFNVQQQR